MTVQEQERILKQIKDKSAANEVANTINRTKIEGYIEQCSEVLNSFTEEEKKELGVDIDRFTDQEYLESLIRSLKLKKSVNDELFESMSKDALQLLGI